MIKLSCLFWHFYANNCVESQGIIIIVHFNITLIFVDSFPNTFYTKTMSVLIRLVSGQTALWIWERIFSARVYDGYHNKRGIGSSNCIYFNKSFGNVAGSFHGIIQQVAKQGSKIAVCNKVGCSMPYIALILSCSFLSFSKSMDCRCFLMLWIKMFWFSFWDNNIW